MKTTLGIEMFLNRKIKFLSLALVCFAATTASGQDLIFENEAPIAVHEKRVSSVNFPTTKSSDKGLSSKIVLLHFLPINSENSKEYQKIINFSIPAKCSESRVQMDEVFHHTEGSEALNVLVYDPRDEKQLANAAKVKSVTVPWDPTYDQYAGFDNVDAKLQDVIRALNPSCLPARFQFKYVGSKRYNEIRYGEKVWE